MRSEILKKIPCYALLNLFFEIDIRWEHKNIPDFIKIKIFRKLFSTTSQCLNSLLRIHLMDFILI